MSKRLLFAVLICVLLVTANVVLAIVFHLELHDVTDYAIDNCQCAGERDSQLLALGSYQWYHLGLTAVNLVFIAAGALSLFQVKEAKAPHA